MAKTTKPARIVAVETGSIADEAGIEPGDLLVSIDDQPVTDIFDYRFLISSEALLLVVRKPDGEDWEIDIEKEEDEDLGLTFEHDMITAATRCTNNCVFCFIDQMPPDMRETLYFKDDDSRLSFLTGNYVTLTNMKDDDLDRIIRYRMSPINVSVHTTNPDLRVRMLGNRFAGDVLKKIRKLTDAGITVNAQIVLCRGWNDGAELQRSLSDLACLYPGVYSVSVVPVGLTRFRENLAELTPFDSESAAGVIREVSLLAYETHRRCGSRVMYLADEFYLLAGLPLPEEEAYEDFPQIENGVGLITSMKSEILQTLSEVPAGAVRERVVSVATGTSAYGFIREMSDLMERHFQGLTVRTYPVVNQFFGPTVTVSGLLTGSDLRGRLQKEDLGSALFISRSMLKSEALVFLDDMTLDQLSGELGTEICPVVNEGRTFVEMIAGIKV